MLRLVTGQGSQMRATSKVIYSGSPLAQTCLGRGVGGEGPSGRGQNRRGNMNRRSRRDPEAIAFARDQRARANEFAHDVWQMVRNRRCRGKKFRREYPISPYMTDFCCPALKLIIAVDGDHHHTEEGRLHDQRRDQYLRELGYEVHRIPGYEVLRNAAGVRRMIEQAIDERTKQPAPSPPTPLPRDEGEHHSPSSRGRGGTERYLLRHTDCTSR